MPGKTLFGSIGNLSYQLGNSLGYLLIMIAVVMAIYAVFTGQLKLLCFVLLGVVYLEFGVAALHQIVQDGWS